MKVVAFPVRGIVIYIKKTKKNQISSQSASWYNFSAGALEPSTGHHVLLPPTGSTNSAEFLVQKCSDADA